MQQASTWDRVHLFLTGHEGQSNEGFWLHPVSSQAKGRLRGPGAHTERQKKKGIAAPLTTPSGDI